jgi:DNA recombination protein RmuC
MNYLPSILIGALLGAVIGWLLRALRSPQSDRRVEEELRRQVEDREMQLGQLRGELTGAREARAAAEAARTAAENSRDKLNHEFEQLARRAEDQRTAAAAAVAETAKLSAQLQSRESTLAETSSALKTKVTQLDDLNRELLELKRVNGQLATDLSHAKETLGTERKQLETLQEKFRKDFEAISNELLIRSSNRFKQESSERLNELLAPLKTSLSEVKGSLETTRKETEVHSTLLKEQISRIGAEAANLSKALKGDVKMLGNWGENILDRLLETSGLKRDIHYRRQVGVRDQENNSRIIDVIVDLGEGRNIIIDSKVSLNSYEEWINCTDDTRRPTHLAAHTRAVRSHFEKLGDKAYHDCVGLNAPDWVLMYIPIEGAFSAAISDDATLFNDALNRKVILVSNSSLLAALRTVRHVWNVREQERNAQKIAELGGRLYDKIVGFVEDLEDIGKALNSANRAYDDAFKKLKTGRGNLISQSTHLMELGAKAKKALPAPLVDDAQDENLTSLEIPPLRTDPPPQLPCEEKTGL